MMIRSASLRAIAERLNADAVATAHGGRRWYASTVRAVLERHGRQRGRLRGADPRSP
jgi:hypothetical protein